MTSTLQIKACYSFKVGGDAPDDAFAVEAILNNGIHVYHRGPKDAAFFTESKAEKLATKVFLAGEINKENWMSVRGKQL